MNAFAPVPRDWGKKEVVWTLTLRGKTERAVGWLQPEWEIESFPGETRIEKTPNEPRKRSEDTQVGGRKQYGRILENAGHAGNTGWVRGHRVLRKAIKADRSSAFNVRPKGWPGTE